LGALQQLQQVGSGRRIGDIMTWLQCYSMNAVVMSKQKPELVAPILAHMHRVMCIDTAKGGMLQYDWKPQRVINTDSLASWEKCNP